MKFGTSLSLGRGYVDDDIQVVKEVCGSKANKIVKKIKESANEKPKKRGRKKKSEDNA